MLGKIIFITVSCAITLIAAGDNDNVPVDPKANLHKKRMMNCGFKTPVDLTNNQNLMFVQQMANNVVTAMNRNPNWNNPYAKGLANVINASVMGNCYDITFTIGQTTCINNRVMLWSYGRVSHYS